MERRSDKPEMDLSLLDASERRAVDALRSLRADRAPDRLRAQIDALHVAPVRRRREWRRPAFGLLAAGAAAAAVVAALVATTGGPGASSVLQAAALALRGPVIAAPVPDRQAPRMRLGRAVQEIYFPNWTRFGWRATGQRTDRLDGRVAVTVYYANARQEIAYTILTRPAMRPPGGGASKFDGTQFKTLRVSHRMVVTWRRLGHTCVLSGAGVSERTLFTLASWHPAGSGSSWG